MASSRKALRLLQLAKEILELEHAVALRKREFMRLAGEDAQMELPIDRAVVEQVQNAPRPTLARTNPTDSLPRRVQSLLDMNPRP